MSKNENQLIYKTSTEFVEVPELAVVGEFLEDDKICGQIVINLSSRTLKFFCVMCKRIIVNIDNFCNHLSVHLQSFDETTNILSFGNEEESQQTIIISNDELSAADEVPETITVVGSEEITAGIVDIEKSEWTERLNETKKGITEIFDQHCESENYYIDENEQHFTQEDIDKFYDTSEMIIEETDNESVIEMDIDGNLRKLPNKITSNKSNSSYIGEFMAYHENRSNAQTNCIAVDSSYEDGKKPNISENKVIKSERSKENILNKGNSTDFEKLIQSSTIKESKVEKVELKKEVAIPSNVKRRTYIQQKRLNSKYLQEKTNAKRLQKIEKQKKKKKVTTVKIIAVKNRIAELYEKIKSEEEKRSKLPTIDNSGIENYKSMQQNSTNNLNTTIDNLYQFQPGSNQKIIGETIISLLPEGETTVPYPLPMNTMNSVAVNNSPIAANKPDKSCICPACDKVFRSSFSLTIHKRTHYLESKSHIKLAHKCCECDHLFNKIAEMKEHLHKIHYPDGYICKICSKKLTSLTLLESHMRKVHLSRPFNCNICKKNFDNREYFEMHVNAHDVLTQNYKCRICGRKYPTENMLNQHFRRHKEQVPQVCVVCGKRTLRITQHMKIHTPRPKRVLSCKVCGKVFNFSSGLSTHFRVMHKFPRSPPKLKTENQNSNANANVNAIKRKRKTRERSKTQMENLNIIDDEVTHKEEEAKRVIVELIQNAAYTSFLPENYVNNIEGGPPIAREETICAVNSIVDN